MANENTIWFHPQLNLEMVNKISQVNMVKTLGIELTELGKDYLCGTMPVDERTCQPQHILHGGASCVLAESLGSIAANCVFDNKAHVAFGLEINANHIRPVKMGEWVKGTARVQHLGQTTQVWEILITNPKEKLVCISRLTMAVRALEN